MIKPSPFQLSSSITDFAPLFGDLEYLFKKLKNTGIDGIELVIGIKSRWSAKRIRYLSQKYDLPIRSIHQPIWSGLGVDIWFDEGFVDVAKVLGTNKVVFHPLMNIPFHHNHMQSYLKKLAQLQEDKGIEVLLENLPRQYKPKIANYFFSSAKDTMDMEALFHVTETFGLKINLDIDHLKLPAPHEEPWFQKVLPRIGNIHLSSFAPGKEHLPLYLGDFQVKEFIQALRDNNYKGLLTCELYYPQVIDWFGYEFASVKQSVALVKSV